MTVKTVTIYSDDLDGSTEDVQTQRFMLDGTDYAMELSAENQAKFRQALSPYIAVARRAGGRHKPAKSKSKPAVSTAPATPNGNAPANAPASAPAPVSRPPDVSTLQIRTWAKSRGYAVKDRGRIPEDIIREYQAAH